jgi:general stress protein 26
MSTLDQIAQPFIDVAHRIVWASVATVDTSNRPRSRILHPIWEYDGDRLTGWIATGPTPVKTAHLAHRPYVSVNYWDAQHDVATAECHITWHHDDATCIRIWDMLKGAPAPLGFDPSMIPAWTEPTQPEFAVLQLDPWRLRVYPGTMLLAREGEVLDWSR